MASPPHDTLRTASYQRSFPLRIDICNCTCRKHAGVTAPATTPACPVARLQAAAGGSTRLPQFSSPANALGLTITVPTRKDPLDPTVASRLAIVDLIDDLPVNSKFKAFLISKVPSTQTKISPPGTGFAGARAVVRSARSEGIWRQGQRHVCRRHLARDGRQAQRDLRRPGATASSFSISPAPRGKAGRMSKPTGSCFSAFRPHLSASVSAKKVVSRFQWRSAPASS